MSSANLSGLTDRTASWRSEAARWDESSIGDEHDNDRLGAPKGILVGLAIMLPVWLTVAAFVLR